MGNELARVFDKIDELKETVQENHVAVTQRLTKLETKIEMHPVVKQPCSFLSDHLNDAKLTKREIAIGATMAFISAALAFFGKHI